MTRDISPSTVPMLSLTSWLKAGSRCGINAMDFFEDRGLHLDLAHLQHTRIPPMHQLKALNDCTQAAKRAHFPLVLGDTLVFDHAPTAEAFLATCPTMRDALTLTDWAQVFNPWFKIKLHEHEGNSEAWLTFDQPFLHSEAPPLRYVTEATMVWIKRAGFGLFGTPRHLRAIHFMHSKPDYHDQYAHYFQVEPKYDQSRNALFFDRQYLDEPLPGAQPQINLQARNWLMAHVPGLIKADNFPRQFIDRLLSDPDLIAGDLNTMALAFGMSGRTLQRRLSKEGQGFTEVLNFAQEKLARQWLVDTDADINTISTRLGYKSRRAFTSAFKHWTGLTPSQHRHDAKRQALDIPKDRGGAMENTRDHGSRPFR